MPTLSTCPRLVQSALGSHPGWPGWYYLDPTYCLYVTVSVTVTSLREAATGKRRDVHEALKPEAEALSPANPRDGAWPDWGVANFCQGDTQKRRSQDRGAETELATSLKSKYRSTLRQFSQSYGNCCFRHFCCRQSDIDIWQESRFRKRMFDFYFRAQYMNLIIMAS